MVSGRIGSKAAAGLHSKRWSDESYARVYTDKRTHIHTHAVIIFAYVVLQH